MNNKITLGIIGAGRIAKVHAESITSAIAAAEIKTVADPYINEETEKWFKEKGIPNVTKDAADIFNDSEIDAVLICSSTDTHAEFTRKAAECGKHIFCEKPLDLDIDRIKETLKIVEAAGVKFQIGFNRRFDHNFKAVRDAVVAGSVGEPHIVRITSRDPAPPDPRYIAVSGGIFMDMTIHDFDMVRYLSGSEVDEIFVQGAVLVDPEIGKAGDIDTAVISMKLQNGAIAVIDNSRKAAYGYDQRAEVFGSKGAVETSNDAPSTMVMSNEAGVTAEKPLYFFLERYMESFSREVRMFVDSVKNGTETPVGALDALRPVQIAKAARESLDTGKPVKVKY